MKRIEEEIFEVEGIEERKGLLEQLEVGLAELKKRRFEHVTLYMSNKHANYIMRLISEDIERSTRYEDNN